MTSLGLVTLAMAAISAASAQGVAGIRPAACTGDTITTIAIHSAPPPFNGWSGVWRRVGDAGRLHHTVTHPRVILAYLPLAVGHLCTIRNVNEAERLLRLQPYLAAATVRAVPDGAHRVRIEVETTDEVAAVGALRLDGRSLAGVALGSENAFGEGLTLGVSGTRGFAYRSGLGVSVTDYGAFNGPYTLGGSAERDPLGGAWSLDFAHPFLTDLERSAFHTGAAEQRSYYPIVRPAGDNLAMSVRRSTYDAGAVVRVGSGSVVGLLGGALFGETANVGTEPVIVADTGLALVPPSEQTVLGGRFGEFHVTRLAAIGGLRALRFATVSGFDALAAKQDVAQGVQFGALAGPSMFSSTSKSDVFLSVDAYAGVGGPRSFLTARFLGEGREDRMAGAWESLVSSGRLAWYSTPSPPVTRIASLEVSAVQHLDLPIQLTFQDHVGGLPGYPNATFAGGRRAILRVEQRRLLPSMSARADAAVGLFVDAGKLWAGDVPYGVTTSVRTSVGVSLFTAIPAGSRRTYRLDFAVPLNRPPGGSRFELRLSSDDLTRLLWTEPADVARARAGAPLANLLAWTAR